MIFLSRDAIVSKDERLSVFQITHKEELERFPNVTKKYVLSGIFEVDDPKVNKVILDCILKDSKGRVYDRSNKPIIYSFKKNEDKARIFTIYLKPIPVEVPTNLIFSVIANNQPLGECTLSIEKRKVL